MQNDGCGNTSVSISGAEINLALRAVTTYVPCSNLAPSMSVVEEGCFTPSFCGGISSTCGGIN